MDVVWSVLESLHFEKTTFFCQVGLFFVLHYSLKFLVYTPIMQIREVRDSKIASSLAEAESATAAARQLKSDYEEKVRGARADGQIALQKASDQAEAERKTRVEKARVKAAALLDEARAEAEAVLLKANESLESQSESVARAIASKLLSSSLDDSEAKALMSKVGGAS